LDLSEPICADLIVIDLSSISNKATSIFEIINMISTYSCYENRSQTISILIDKNDNVIDIQECLDTSIKGFIPKIYWLGSNETENAIKELLAGHTYMPKRIIAEIKKNVSTGTSKHKSDTISLTHRQEQVLKLICHRGASNKVIAKIMSISESTVKLHVTAILKKYGARNRTQLAVFVNDAARTKSPLII
jgi:DNA-binding NarL/FixJ family response regulator